MIRRRSARARGSSRRRWASSSRQRHEPRHGADRVRERSAARRDPQIVQGPRVGITKATELHGASAWRAAGTSRARRASLPPGGRRRSPTASRRRARTAAAAAHRLRSVPAPRRRAEPGFAGAWRFGRSRRVLREGGARPIRGSPLGPPPYPAPAAASALVPAVPLPVAGAGPAAAVARRLPSVRRHRSSTARAKRRPSPASVLRLSVAVRLAGRGPFGAFAIDLDRGGLKSLAR